MCVCAESNKKEVLEPLTVLESPPVVVVGIVGYIHTAHGIRCIKTIWAEHLGEECRRRFYQNWSVPSVLTAYYAYDKAHIVLLYETDLF